MAPEAQEAQDAHVQQGSSVQKSQNTPVDSSTVGSANTSTNGSSHGSTKGSALTIALVAVLSCAAPIATDLYLPALPDMPAYFNTTEAVINFTLVGFFLFMAIGMLIFGPLSDRFGRKKPLIFAIVLFATSAAIGSVVSSIELLVALRVLQGIGGGGMVAISTAIVKDCFEGRARERALVIVQAMSVVGPMIAPVLGSIILSFTDWRGTFVAQAILGLLALPLTVALREPLPPGERIDEGVLASFSKLLVCAKNLPFMLLLILCALNAAPFMCYLSSVSYIYLDFFDLSKFQYSFFFAINAGLSAVGAFIVVVVNGRISPKKSLVIAFVASFIGGLLLALFGHVSALAFFLCFAVYSLAGGYARPISTIILLDQQERDTGSLSSLINFVNSMLMTGGMLTATLPWPDHVWGVAVIVLVGTGVSFVGLLALMKSPFKPKGL